MPFSATDAAFEGFRLVRRNPLALVAWTLLYAVLTLAALFSLSGVVDRFEAWAEQAEAMEASTEPTLQQVTALMSSFGQVMLGVAWLLPVGLLLGAMLSAAVARGVLTPSKDRFGYLRLGMDEVRVLAVTFVIGLVMTLVVVLAIFAVGVVTGLAKAGAGDGLAAILALLGILATLCLLIWLAVRLCLAVPITVAENRFAFFDSFRLTKGRFWPLLGMAVLAFVMVMLVQLLSSIVSMPVAIMSGVESWSFGTGQDPEAVRAALDVTNPWVIANALIEAVVSALTVGILYAPFAAAYRDITAAGPRPTAI